MHFIQNTRIKANFGSRPFVYADGANHHHNGDDYLDTVQDVKETFKALPFNVGSDSDSDGAPSSGSPTSDVTLGGLKTPPGPPCRVPAIPKSLKEYNSEASIHYKLLPCYENFPTTGPDLRTQLANQDDESDLDDQDDEEPVEDHYALLVKAWEQKVFPTIRRRFRNEAERKDGLEQIRGALQLGMTDIARQTVEFLYEENGGIPRDLHLPTIDDIKEELAKFTIERVRKGTTVVIRNQQTQSSTGTTLIPKFAVRGMLKTFGLSGVVLDVDQPNELVQVETYLRSEGVLVRFWYPLDMLERPPQGYRKASIIGNQVLDTSNIHIHRELLRCQSLLARMHCRTALLELINQCNSPAMEMSCTPTLSAMAASAALLQELDVENLQLLSNELLVPPQPHGCVRATSLLTSQSAEQCLSSHTCSLSDILYMGSHRLKEELRVAIARAANQGEDYLIELSNQICMCLQTAPEMFPFEEFPISETKISTDVHFPGAAFIVVSCKADPKAIKKDTSLYKSPWARIFTYRSHRIKKTGQCAKQEVVCYPRDTTSSSNQSDQYSPVIIPSDLVHVRVGVSPPPGVIVTIHAIPAQFALAISYIETLVSQKHNFEYRLYDLDLGKAYEVDGCQGATGGEPVAMAASSSSLLSNEGATSPWRTFDSTVIPPLVMYHVVELLGDYLWRSDSPALIKEYMFHLLAQTLRVLQISEGNTPGAKSPPILGAHLTSSFTLLLQLNTELKKLYEEETKHWPSGTTLAGSGMGLGVGDQGRFSTYFHSLMEVSLAIAEVTSPILPGHGSSPSSASLEGTKPSTSSVPLPAVPTSPIASGKRKKLKAKRERDRGSTTPKRSASPHRLSESESSLSSSPGNTPTPVSAASSSTSATSGSSVGLSSSKPEDMLWFHRALTMTQIMRYLVYNDHIGQGVITDAVVDAAQSLSDPTAHHRLLVITGIPPNLDSQLLKLALSKVCNSYGGLFRDELYLPVEQVFVKPSHPKDTDNQQVKPKVTATAEASLVHEAQAGQKTEGGQETKQQLKGFAVLQIRSKVKVEPLCKELRKNKLILHKLDVIPDELVDISDDTLKISTINSSLISESPDANAAMEDFLFNKLISSNMNPVELNDTAMIALTEIFHSCFISEQRLSLSESRQESGYICLGKEQIMNQTQGNLMHVFFFNIRSPKKTFTEQVAMVLRRYGVPKVIDKDDSDKKSKSVKKTAKSSSKEKVAMGATATRAAARERKVKPKEVPEKSAKDSSSTEGASKGVPKESPREDDKLLTLDGFLSYVTDQIKHDVRTVWRALFACGFDLHLERCSCIDLSQAQQMCEQWTLDMDTALVQYVNRLCQHLAIAPARLHAHELYITEAEMTGAAYAPLQGFPLESVRLRFALLQSLNNTLETFFLPLIDLRPAICSTFSRSMAMLLSNARGLIFYDTKTLIINRILNATALRKPDQAAPEITLDPLENVGGERKPPMDTNFCQALRQLSAVSSSQLCVRLAAGGDPTYAFNVRFTGEEVHGTSGSFRHFLWQVARELESSILDLFIPCPSSASHRNRGKLILKPGPMTYAEEKMLQFLGQLFAVTVRADIPFGLDLLPVFWKNMAGVDLDPVIDLQEADIITYSYIKKFEMMESETELYSMYADQMPRFVYNSLNGDEIELIPNGRNVVVNWENRQQYVDQIRLLRLRELVCKERVMTLRSGIATVFPLQLLGLMTPRDVELRTCGLPEVNIDFLKAHTMYQVGLMDTDPHIQFFWHVLEGFSQDDLCKFIKFACNQERIPQTCPCKNGSPDTAHVPPYPMKIAPPDGPGKPDARYVRVETCMFMIKLPQYSTEELMRERLLYAIHCREDPLSG